MIEQEAQMAEGEQRTASVAAISLSFDEFYRTHYPPVTRLLYAVTGRWSVSEELAQDALLVAFRRWDRVRVLDRPDLWLRRVALNRAISTHRRAASEIAAVRRLRGSRALDPPEPDEISDEVVWTAVRRLPRRQRVAIVLRAVEQLSYREIGEVLDSSEESARTHVRRARASLQHILETKETSR